MPQITTPMSVRRRLARRALPALAAAAGVAALAGSATAAPGHHGPGHAPPAPHHQVASGAHVGGPPPAPGYRGPRAERPAPPQHHPAGERPLASNERQATLTGTATALSYGRHGEAKGLVLDDGTEVKAPPHAQLVDLASLVGRSVSATGILKPAKIHHGSVESGGELLFADREPRHGPPAGEQRVSRTATVAGLVTGPRGEVKGLALEDGTEVDVPRHVAYDIDTTGLVGRRIEVTGFQKPAELKDATIRSGGQIVSDDRGPRLGSR